MINPVSYPLFQAVDNDGFLLEGGLLYTYYVGTSTPKAAYADSSFQTALTNPIILDARGERLIYVPDQTDFVLKDADGAVIWGPVTMGGENGAWITDGLAGAITDIGSAETLLHMAPGTYTLAANLTVPTNVTLCPERGSVIDRAGYTITFEGGLDAGLYQIFSGSGKVEFAKESPVSMLYPEWWGAKGDFVTDCAAAIQEAIDARPVLDTSTDIKTGWPIIQFGPGGYVIETALNLSNTRVNGTIQRDGIHIKGTSYFTGTKILMNTGNLGIDAVGCNYFFLEDIVLDSRMNFSGTTSTLSNPSVVGILMAANAATTPATPGQFDYFKNVTVILHDDTTANSNHGTIGILNIGAEDATFNTCWIEANSPAIFATTNAYAYGVTSINGTIPTLHSMSGITFLGDNVIRIVEARQPGVILSDAACFFFNGTMLNNGNTGTNDVCFWIASAVQTMEIKGGFENPGTLFKLDGALINAKAIANIANATNASAPVISVTANSGYLMECDLSLNISNQITRNLIEVTGGATNTYGRNTTIKTNLAKAYAITSLDTNFLNYSAGKNFVINASDGRLDSNSLWVDYHTGANTQGFSSFTKEEVFYKVVGDDEVHLLFDLEGTSNANGISFTAPFTAAAAPTLFRSFIYVADNGSPVAAPGMATMDAATATVTIYKTGAGGAFTAANGKAAIGMLVYRK